MGDVGDKREDKHKNQAQKFRAGRRVDSFIRQLKYNKVQTVLKTDGKSQG